MPNIYYKDAAPRVSISIKDTNGAFTDPTGLVFTLIDPNNVTHTVNYVYPESAGLNLIHKTAQGQYYIEWYSNIVGEYTFKFQATGNMIAAIKGSYQIRDITP